MPAPRYDFDLFVIGGGSAGVRGARMAAGMGARVALAECAALGGTCVNVGCIPKKLYSYAAGYAEAFEEARGFGWQLAGKPRLDWEQLKAARAREIKRLNGVYRSLLDGVGVTLLQGWAQFVDAHTVQVDGKQVSARHILLASGGKPKAPQLAGGELALVSDDIFDLAQFPERLLVVGSGYIACEFASIFNGLGAQVSLLLRKAHVLAGFDEDLRRYLADEMDKAGVDLRFNSPVETLSRGEHGAIDALLPRGQRVTGDAVLYAIGRVPLTEGLGLEAAGVQLRSDGAVEVDAHYQSSQPSVYAVGDVSTSMQLTPVALAEAMVVVDRLFGKGRRRLDYRYVPTAVFTHPSVGTCGRTEAQARAEFGDAHIAIYESEFKPLRHTLSGRSERCFMKLVVETKSDRVVGLHMVGSDAGEIVQGFAVAMNAGATKAQFDATVGIHPTTAEEFVTMRTPSPG